MAHKPLTRKERPRDLQTMREVGDRKLATRLLKGDQRSFDIFFNSYFPKIYRFALVRVDHDHSLAEDIAQNVLCQAISKISTYRGEAPLFSWLCTFCRYEVSRQRRAHGFPRKATSLTEDDPAIRAALESLLHSTGDDPDVAAYQAELGRLVKVALDHLPALYADSLESKYVHGFTVREIAKRIGKSEKATESILTRARIAFRSCYKTLVQEDERLPGDNDCVLTVAE